eukprot:377614-Alexandrium_andersonii.AAC.1
MRPGSRVRNCHTPPTRRSRRAESASGVRKLARESRREAAGEQELPSSPPTRAETATGQRASSNAGSSRKESEPLA